MGQEESTAARDESVPESEEVFLVKCPHCKREQATYRCRRVVEEMSGIYNQDEMLPYWKPCFFIEDGDYHLSYIACENCITEEMKRVFTHHPEGWKEKVTTNTVYELAK